MLVRIVIRGTALTYVDSSLLSKPWKMLSFRQAQNWQGEACYSGKGKLAILEKKNLTALFRDVLWVQLPC